MLIFNYLRSVYLDEAPNFPPNDLGAFERINIGTSGYLLQLEMVKLPYLTVLAHTKHEARQK